MLSIITFAPCQAHLYTDAYKRYFKEAAATYLERGDA